MAKTLDKSQEEAARKQGVEDALKGEYDPNKASKPYWRIDRGNEAEEVYKDAFFKTRGGKGK